MRRWFPFLLAPALMAAFAAAPVRGHFDARPVQAADAWNVQVGGDIEPEHGTAIGFFPAILNIRVGDSVAWNFVPAQDPHTVSFLAGQPPPGEEFINGPEGEQIFGPAVFPFGPVGPNATFDGSTQISSGIPTDPDTPPFKISFTATGVFDYLCLIHGPSMSGQIRVSDGGSSLPETPDQARARGQADFQELVDMVRGAVSGEGEGPPPPPPVTTAGGATIHTVSAGVSLFGRFADVAGLIYLPPEMTVRRGDVVVWTVSDPNEIHTVTFTSGGPVPDFIEVRPQPDGPPQLVIPASVTGPAGGTTYTGTGMVSSGILGATQSFSLLINAPPGRYDYLCLVHPTVMKGSITVTP